MLGEKLHQQIHYYLVITFCVTIPFLYRAASLSLAILTLNWLISGVWIQNRKRLIHPISIIFIVFFVLHLLGMTYTEDILDGWSVVEKKLSLLILPLVFFTTKTIDKNKITPIIKAFIFGNIISLITALSFASYQFYTTNIGYKAYFYTKLLSGGLRHPTYVGLGAGIAILILLFLLFQKKIISKFERKIAILLIPIFALFLLLLNSRMVLLSFGVVFIALALLYFINNRFWIKGFIFIIIISISGIGIYNIPEINRRIHTVSRDARPNLWRAASVVIKDNLLVGVGTGDVQKNLLPVYKERELTVPFKKSYNTHNIFLQPLIMLGIIGLIFFGLTFLLPLGMSYHTNKLYFTIIIFFIITGTTEALLERQEGIMLYVFIIIFGFTNFIQNNRKAINI